MPLPRLIYIRLWSPGVAMHVETSDQSSCATTFCSVKRNVYVYFVSCILDVFQTMRSKSASQRIAADDVSYVGTAPTFTPIACRCSFCWRFRNPSTVPCCVKQELQLQRSICFELSRRAAPCPPPAATCRLYRPGIHPCMSCRLVLLNAPLSTRDTTPNSLFSLCIIVQFPQHPLTTHSFEGDTHLRRTVSVEATI